MSSADLGSGAQGSWALIAIDRVFLHERTGAAALKSMAVAGRPVLDPARVFAVMDHIVDTRPGRGDATSMPGGQAFITETRDASHAAGITLFDVNDPDQGITHVISPELGIVLPGVTLVAPDSHTCTQGHSARSPGASGRPKPNMRWRQGRCGCSDRRRCALRSPARCNPV